MGVIALIESLSVSDIVLVGAFLAIVIDRVADTRGWSRSSKTLRRENEDLVRRNGELEQTVGRHEEKIKHLEQKVADLERTNQAAVLAAVAKHEKQADVRHARTLTVLTEIRDTLKEGVAS